MQYPWKKNENLYRAFLVECEKKRLFGKAKRRWKDNIEIGFYKSDGRTWSWFVWLRILSSDCIRVHEWRTSGLRKIQGNFLTSWLTPFSSRGTLVRIVASHGRAKHVACIVILSSYFVSYGQCEAPTTAKITKSSETHPIYLLSTYIWFYSCLIM